MADSQHQHMMDHHAHHNNVTHANMDHNMHHNMHHNMDDMGDMDMSSGSHMMMMMTFHFGYNETILFSFWTISSASGLIGSMVGIFFLSALYEGLKYYREHLFWKTHNALQYRSVETPANKENTPQDENVVQPSMLSKSHVVQTFLHLIQIVISYFLMLIFMTFNVWLCVAVTLGLTTGYFLFGWKKSVIIDVTEHCH